MSNAEKERNTLGASTGAEELTGELEQLSDKSLEQLKKWLTNEGNSAGRATFATESIRVFYLHYILPAIRHPAEVGITTRRAEYGGQHVWLHTLWPTKLAIDSAEQSTQINDLIEAFTKSTAIPLLPNPSLHLDFISQGNPKNETFEDIVRDICKAENSEYIGIIRAELTSPTPSSTP